MAPIEDPVTLRREWVKTVGSPAVRRALPPPQRTVAKLLTAVRWPREQAAQMDRFRRAAKSRNMDYSDLVNAMFVLLERAWEQAPNDEALAALLADLGLEPVTN